MLRSAARVFSYCRPARDCTLYAMLARVRSAATAMMGVDTYSDDLDLTVQHAAGSAELKGSVGKFNTLRSWDEIVSVNDVPFAKVGGSVVPEDQGPRITPLGGRLFFTSEEQRVLLEFVSAPGAIGAGLAGVLGAGTHLVRIALRGTNAASVPVCAVRSDAARAHPAGTSPPHPPPSERTSSPIRQRSETEAARLPGRTGGQPRG